MDEHTTVVDKSEVSNEKMKQIFERLLKIAEMHSKTNDLLFNEIERLSGRVERQSVLIIVLFVAFFAMGIAVAFRLHG